MELKFTPMEVYQFTASAKPSEEVKLDWFTFIDAALKMTEEPNKTGLPILCECLEGYHARIQIREMKGLAAGQFKDVRFLATFANGVSTELNDKDFGFNNFRIRNQRERIKTRKNVCVIIADITRVRREEGDVIFRHSYVVVIVYFFVDTFRVKDGV